MTTGEFAQQVICFCTMFAASETSGFRTTMHNTAEHGVAHSAHRVGLGRDVVYDVIPDEAVARKWAGALGLKLTREVDHDHLEPLGWEPG